MARPAGRERRGEMIEHKAYNWLVQCPVNDSNYISALKRASVDELQRAIGYMQGKPNNKSRITACERELRRRKGDEQDE